MKRIIKTIGILSIALSTNAQERLSLGLRTGVSSNFHIKEPPLSAHQNYIGDRTALSNELFANYAFGKNRKLLLEAGLSYSKITETTQSFYRPEFSSVTYSQMTKGTLQTLSPTLRISYQLAKCKAGNWTHYAGISLSRDFNFYKSRTIETLGSNAVSLDKYAYGSNYGGIHYNGIIGLTTKLSVNYLFSVSTYLDYVSHMMDTRSYNYRGMFGLSYKL